MADIETFNRLALAMPDVAAKKHFRYEGFAVHGQSFAHVKQGDVYLALDRAQAETLAGDHEQIVFVLKRNETPIGVRAALRDLDEALLADLLRRSRDFKAK